MGMSEVRRRIAQLPAGDTVPIRDALAAGGAPPQAHRPMIQAGLVIPLPGRGRGHGGPFVIDRDQAVRLVAAGVLATAAGCSLASVVRLARRAGLDVLALAENLE